MVHFLPALGKMCGNVKTVNMSISGSLPLNISSQGFQCLCWCCCSVTQSCLTLCDSMDCSIPGFPVLYYLPEFAQTHVNWVNDAIKLSHPLWPLSLPAVNLSQHQGLFQWTGYFYQVVKVLELHLQHQSFQWIFRTDYF